MQKTIKRQLNILKNTKNKDFLVKVSVFSVILLSSSFLTGSVLAQKIENIKYPNLEREIINQLNQERAENNLHPLKFSPELRKAAEVKVRDLIENKYFLHTSPEGIKAWDILEDIGYNYKYAGENLAMKFKDAVSVHNAWMKSKSHKENILFKNYTEVAVAIDERRDGSLVAVEFFGKPIKDSITTEEGNTEEKNSENENGKSVAQVGRGDKYDGGTGNLLTQVVPKSNLIKDKNIGGVIPVGLSADQVMSLNNMILLVVGIVCLILVVNIWVLEKEDERIVAEEKRLCDTKKALVSG